MTQPEPRPSLRIGDAERDDAATLLSEHLTAGRLEHREFDARLDAALAAHTQAELDALFTDLPGRRPGHERAPARHQAVAGVPQPTDALDLPEQLPYREPWWTHWGLFVTAIILSTASRGELWWLIPAAAVWVWWIGPTVAVRRHDERQLRERSRRRRELR